MSFAGGIPYFCPNESRHHAREVAPPNSARIGPGSVQELLGRRRGQEFFTSAFAVAIGGKVDMTIALRNVRFWPKADIGRARWVAKFEVLPRPASASAAGFVDTEGDQQEGGCHEHPGRMSTARRPKVAESAKQVEAANE